MAGEARGTVGSNEPEAAHSVRGMGALLSCGESVARSLRRDTMQ
jgi:hypothetical protein